MVESLLVGRNFVSGICKLKPKKNYFFGLKNPRLLSALVLTGQHEGHLAYPQQFFIGDPENCSGKTITE